MVEEDKLLVFISWSKHLAREVAVGLKEYLEIVFDPVVLPWMSEQDVELGSRSMAELGETLDRSSFGIIVVTRTNQNSQWVNFEAGALSKKVGDPAVSVIPLLVDFDSPTDLTGPLAQFQAIVYGREQLLRMMLVISGRAGVSRRTVQHRFDTHWTTFDDQVQLALKAHPTEASVPQRGNEDKTDEMLAILRRLQSTQRAGQLSSPVREPTPGQLDPRSISFRQMMRKFDIAAYAIAGLNILFRIEPEWSLAKVENLSFQIGEFAPRYRVIPVIADVYEQATRGGAVDARDALESLIRAMGGHVLESDDEFKMFGQW